MSWPNHTEWIGSYGVTPIGFFRVKVGTCEKCGARDIVLCRVWSHSGGYRQYYIGEYCGTCARALAAQKSERDEAERHEQILREWNT